MFTFVTVPRADLLCKIMVSDIWLFVFLSEDIKRYLIFLPEKGGGWRNDFGVISDYSVYINSFCIFSWQYPRVAI